jgi:hypothetical protein
MESQTWSKGSILAVCGVIGLAALGFGADAGDVRAPQGPSALSDLRSLPLLRTEATLAVTDSHDVTGDNNDGFAASYSYLYKDGEEWVLFDEQGPGCVYQIRTIAHKGTLRVYLDGADDPQLSIPFSELYSGKRAPFVTPFVADEDVAHGSSWSYVPIPFAKACRLTTDEMAPPHFYNVFAHKYATADSELSFDPNAPLDAVPWWSNPTQYPYDTTSDTTLRGSVSVGPGSAQAIAEIAGGGAIWMLRLRIPDDEAHLAAANLVLRGYWDGQGEASIDAPVTSFFALGAPRAIRAAAIADPAKFETKRAIGGTVTPQSLFVGQDDAGWLYCHFPMPYGESARLEIVNTGADPIKLEYIVAHTETPYPWAASSAPVPEGEIAAQRDRIRAIRDEIDASEKRIGELFAEYNALKPEEDDKRPAIHQEHEDLKVRIDALSIERKAAALGDSTGYFHALWRGENPVRAGHDFTVLNTRGQGHFVGCVITFSTSPGVRGRGHLEGDSRFYVDDAQAPLVTGTGTEEYFNWGWYDMLPHDKVFQYPTHGYPLHVVTDADYTVMYRFHVGEVAPYGRAFRFELEHGPVGLVPANYSATAFFYENARPSLVLTDELDVADAASEKEHNYVCADDSIEQCHTLPYEGSHQLARPADAPRDRDRTVKDAGRVWQGSAKFTVKINAENRGVMIRRRSYYGFGADGGLGAVRPKPVLTDKQRVRVLVDGEPVGVWHVPAGHARDTWRDLQFELPARATIGKETLDVTLQTDEGTACDAYHYWVFTRRDMQ